MARQIHGRDIAPILAAAERWLHACLIEDRSAFSQDALWTPALVDEVHHTFVERPDFGEADFMTKLKGQLQDAPSSVQRLMAEMLWALLLFPSNMKARTKRQQVREIWALSGKPLPEDHPLLSDSVLVGIGSGGPGFNNYKPDELAFLVGLTRDLKRRPETERRKILTGYDAFMAWIDSVPVKGNRQFRHMLRFFAFPDRVERISSNNDRRKILEAFGVATSKDTKAWTDQKFDDAVAQLRRDQEAMRPTEILDFYEPPLREQWLSGRKIRTAKGKVTVVVPADDGDEDGDAAPTEDKTPGERQSIQMQAQLAEVGTTMGFKIWIPRSDRKRVRELIPEKGHSALLDELPLNYDDITLDTIENIDVLWLSRHSIVRAFEVEHTTAVYSGLLRMADLLALQPNMNIRLHIVAPDERREKVFREMLRPVFTLLECGPLSERCTFISYESVSAMRSLEHLSHTNDSIIAEYEERADEAEA